jgi:hypothetical protein
VVLVAGALTIKQIRRLPVGGYLTLRVRLRPGQAVVEVLGGPLSIAAAQPVVVALFRIALPPSAAGEVVAQEGIARLKVALPVLADRLVA